MDPAVIFFWLVFVVLIGMWASSWGRSGVGWGLLAFIISPILTALILLVAGKTVEKKAQEAKIIRSLSE